MSRLLMILPLILLAEFYTYIAVRNLSRNLPGGWRTGVLMSYLILTVLVWLSIFLFRAINWAALPHYARNIYIAFAMGFTIGKVLVLIPMLLDDGRRLMQWIAQKFSARPSGGEGISRSVFMQQLGLLLGATALGGFIYGLSNRYNYQVRKLSLRFANLPESFRGLRILQLSDIHSGSFDNEEAVLHGIQKAMAQKPDVILFTGDLVNNIATEIEPYKHLFAQLNAPLGVYSTFGNHDYGTYGGLSPEEQVTNLDRLKEVQKEMGWRLLMNEHVLLQRGEDKIALIGIENWSAKPQFPKHGRMDLAYKGLENEPEMVKILMSHDPSHWDAEVLPKYPYIDLMLAGHTHGMQFGIEIPGLKWSPVKWVYKEWAGLYKEARQHLYVNRGFGFLGYPGRLGILAEITVIDLV